ncbi:hypothetical protein KFE25_002946 [Diacronema lutheri]|uniref:Uncharacterized protein n=1 Tax=Diacronema lutheri TaxID=2081491 RepID=A0A8J6CAL4_DIALT|nr:hypothetical protein KFE25_002946 [Diacronema lutheri]
MQLTKKQRLITGPDVATMLSELDKGSGEHERPLIVQILRAQLAELSCAQEEAEGGAAGGAGSSHPPGPSPQTRVSDIIDSRQATLFKGWIFRHMAADVHTHDVLDSSVLQLAALVAAARGQPLGAQIV